MIRAGILAACVLAATAALAEPEPADYRKDDYRAPVPDTLAGATVISSETAFALWKTGQVAFVDVLPRAPKPADLPEGTIWHEKPRISIPGAIWLPNVGYGQLADVMHAYFRAGLDKATGGDPDQAGGVLLPRRVLDVLERRQAGAGIRVHPGVLVSRRGRSMGGARLSRPRGWSLNRAGSERGLAGTLSPGTSGREPAEGTRPVAGGHLADHAQGFARRSPRCCWKTSWPPRSGAHRLSCRCLRDIHRPQISATGASVSRSKTVTLSAY